MLIVLTMVVAAAAVATAFGVWRLPAVLAAQRQDEVVQRQLALFAPAIAAVQQDPRLLVTWYPIARANRVLFPEAFARLDRAAGGAFPFSAEQVHAAHARWTAEWLAWERAHDAEFSVKTAEVQHDIEQSGHSAALAAPLLRTRLAAIEQQKLERYQQRYEEYIKTAKALAAFMSNT